MMVVGELSRGTNRGRRSQLVAVAVMLVVASAAGIVLANWMIFFLAGLAVTGVIVLLLCRLDLAVALLAADFFFNAYLNHGLGIVTIDKVIGALAVVAWLLEWAVNRRPVVISRQFWVICAFLAWTAVSIVGASYEKAALVTGLRYLTFAVLYFLVMQVVRGEIGRAHV